MFLGTNCYMASIRYLENRNAPTQPILIEYFSALYSTVF